MTDEPNPNPNPVDPPASGAPAVVTRPDYIPETIWDGEKNAPKIDLAATLTEHETLKASAADRAAKVPATADDYKLELPSDFTLPEGYQWKVDPKDPLVAGMRAYAAENKLTNEEVSGLVKLYASHQANELVAQKAFDAKQTELLGGNAEQRRTALTTKIDAMYSKDDPKNAMAKTMLGYADGVDFLEDMIAKAAGVGLQGNPGGNQPPNKNSELADKIGKPGTSAMDIFNAVKA